MGHAAQIVSPGLIQRLRDIIEKPFRRLPYTEAIEILQKADRKWEYAPVWGNDLQSEHERCVPAGLPRTAPAGGRLSRAQVPDGASLQWPGDRH